MSDEQGPTGTSGEATAYSPDDPAGIADLRGLQAEKSRFGWPVYAWGLWDWGSAAFNAVITTFVFSVYITSDSFGDGASSKLGWALAGAGLLVALFAPLTGQRADRSGRRGFWLGVNTFLVILASAGMFFVQPDESYLWLGLLLLAAGNVFFEFAMVNYNAMLTDVSTPATVGRVSGLGWGLGYIGGIVLLLIVYFGLISPEVGLFGVSDEGAMDVRVTMLLCALWTLIFSIPVLRTLRDDERPARGDRTRVGVLASYRLLFASIADLWRTDRSTVWFLLASAVFRDGLAGVFTFGAVIAANVFGFTDGGVIIFGIAANVVAGLATIGFGFLDDALGAKRVIVISLVSMTIAGLAIFFLHDGGTGVFWAFGLVLCIFVGPAQSASRSYLWRLIPPGKEGQVFGLYATTGRAVSFMAPAAFAGAIWIGAQLTGVSDTDDAEYFGILGIIAVVLIGLTLLVTLVKPAREPAAGVRE